MKLSDFPQMLYLYYDHIVSYVLFFGLLAKVESYKVKVNYWPEDNIGKRMKGQ